MPQAGAGPVQFRSCESGETAVLGRGERSSAGDLFCSNSQSSDGPSTVDRHMCRHGPAELEDAGRKFVPVLVCAQDERRN